MKKLLLILTLVIATNNFYAQPTFTPYSYGNPVVAKGIGMQWDKSAVWWPNVTIVNDTIYMVYNGTENFPITPAAIGLAKSTDGKNFTKYNNPILESDGDGFDSHSVSDGLLYYDSDTWYLYYAGKSNNEAQPGEVIGRATANNPQGPWTRNNDTLLTVGDNGAWDDEFISPSTIIPTDSGLVMYYWGGDTWPQATAQIGIAISTDNGATWEKYSGNPILSPGPENYDNIAIMGATVLKSDNNWEMFYSGENINNYSICYSTSPDGITWTKHGKLLTSDEFTFTDILESPSIIKKDSQYYLYYDYGVFGDIGVATAERSSTILEVPFEFSTIQAGIDAASTGDTVLVAEGTYLENINFKGKAITVASHFILDQDTSHISKTIIDGSQPSDPNKGSVVTFNSGEDTNSVICGFTITGGSGSGIEYVRGGGILVYNSVARISNNIIKQNVINAQKNKAAGGGICCHSETPTIKFTIISGNTIIFNKALTTTQPGGYGGGIDVRVSNVKIVANVISHNEVGGGEWCYGPGIRLAHSINNNSIKNNTVSFNSFSNSQSHSGGLFLVQTEGVKVLNNYFEGNSGTFGGGIFDWQSNNLLISNNSFISNSAEQFGGGIYLEGSASELLGNKIINNFAKLTGGGIYCYNFSNPKIKNNLIVNNQAGDNSGGIAIINMSNPEIINNTIVENTAKWGGALSFLLNCDPVIMNTIIYGNTADSSGNQVYVMTEDSEPTFSYCDIEGGIADFSMYQNAFPFPGTYENNMESDPLFADDSTFYLSGGSPCIDAGKPDEIYNDEDGSQNDIGWTGGPKILTSIKEIINVTGQLPSSYNLSQNYPNPFNPSTTIKYSVPSNSLPTVGAVKSETANVETFIRLNVYDILGREVATLVNQKQKPGNYEVVWDASNQPSGVYFYQISTNDFVETKKMLLLR